MSRPSVPPSLSRRDALRTFGLAALGSVALAACGGSTAAITAATTAATPSAPATVTVTQTLNQTQLRTVTVTQQAATVTVTQPVSASAASTRVAAAGGSLTYMDWRLGSSPEDKAFYNAVRDGFVAKNPGVKWEQLQVDFGTTYLEKFTAMAASGTPPDVLFASIIWARDWWLQGFLEDLGPYVARTPSVQPDQYVPPAIYYNSWQGKTFGIPHVGPDFNTYFVNRSALKEVGIPADDAALAAWTWADLFLAHQKMVKRAADGTITRPGVVFSPGNFADVAVSLYSNGGAFYNEQRTAVAFNDTAGQQALQFHADAHTKYKTDDKLPVGGLDLYNKAFPEGGVPILYAGSWNQRNFLGNPAAQSLDYTMMNIPHGPSSTKQATMAWTNMNVMAKVSRNKDTAWAFIEYYSGLEVAGKMFTIWKQASPRIDFLQSQVWQDATRTHPSYANFRKNAETGGIYPYISFTDVSNKLQPVITKAVIDGKLSVQDALAQMQQLANQILQPAK
jgi:multiple sugar transport system substrate-binding protein